MYYTSEDQRNYWTGTDHTNLLALDTVSVTPYACGIQMETDRVLEDYAHHTYLRGWFGLWVFNLTHWLKSEADMAHEALCEIARLKKEAT